MDNMIQSYKPSSSVAGASVVQSLSSHCLSEHDFTFYTDMDGLVGFQIEIISTSDILSEDIRQATLTARVWHGSQNVTESIPAARFQWKRKSADSTADAIWNDAMPG